MTSAIPFGQTDELLFWQKQIRDFADQELIPHEIEAEHNEGVISAEASARHRRMAYELGLSSMDVPKAYGGHEMSNVKQVVAWEQLGRVTNALCWCFAEPEEWMFKACTEAQIEKYILPMIKGDVSTAYAITEEGPGSDASGIQATAHPEGDKYVVNGEKWFVTDANFATYFILQARIMDGDKEVEQALFFVDADTPGIELVETPLFSHTFASHHPTYQFKDVVIPKENRIGQPGDGMTYTWSWFRRERLMIAARCCGAAARLIEEARAFAETRQLADGPLIEKEWVQFALADCATELWAARLMTYEAADAHDRGEDVKILHARCSMSKLYASEMANRVADKALQIFGGRGYMRSNPAERFFRELRVDRIWEGTSEIQRLIIGGRVRKCGLDGL